MQIKDVEAGYKHRIIISVYSYSHIQSLAVGLLEKEIVHGVHRFTMFWSLKRHWLHKIGNQAWGHSLTVSTKRRSVAAATKWPVWAGRQGTLGGGSDLSAGPIKIQSLDKYSAVSERSIVMHTHYQPSGFVTPVLLPSSPSLSLRPILRWSIFNMWRWIASQLPCLVPQEISWLNTATSPTWWLCVGITTHHIMCTSLNSNSCKENGDIMIGDNLFCTNKQPSITLNEQGWVKIFGSFPFQLFYSIVNRKWLSIYKKKQVSKIYVHTDTPVFCHTNVYWHLNY